MVWRNSKRVEGLVIGRVSFFKENPGYSWVVMAPLLSVQGLKMRLWEVPFEANQTIQRLGPENSFK